MCNASRTWNCWNSVGFNGQLATTRIVELITLELSELDGFQDQFLELVRVENKTGAGAERWEQLLRAEKALEVQRANAKASLKEYGPCELVKESMDEIAEQERRLRAERRTLEHLRSRALEIPQSIEGLRRMFHEEFTHLALDSPEFGLLLRRLVPEFHVYLVRLCDSGHLLPRARIKLALAGIVPDAQHVPGLSSFLCRDRTIDLFNPTQMERIRLESVRLAITGLGPKAISQCIAERPTVTAVQHALALDKKMKALGLDTPYVFVPGPPENYRKLRRHRNAKYQFKPLEGYSPPAL